MDDIYLIAEVINSFDEQGSVIVKSHSDFSERFFQLDSVIIDFFGKYRKLEVEFVEKFNSDFLFKFKLFSTIEDILFLIGKKLYVLKEDLCKLPEDAFYIHDLINSDVYVDSKFFGKLIDIYKLPNNDVYVIKNDDGKELLLPALKRYVDNFDKIEKKIFLKPECKDLFDDED
ncbi:MAG: 16S rRNA processing protein RimM [Ignavibacteriae bacterium]|nr:MAG: 16S rRNA processing protein RimM [Ignavibacteriota bacterium]